MMTVSAIFIDIDGTVTETDGTCNSMDRSPLTHLEDLLIEKYSLSRETAHARILASGNMEIQCLSEFLEKLDIDPLDYFFRMKQDLAGHISITRDAITFLKAMKERNVPVYSATTNSKFMTLVKLSVGGIADIHGCPLFRDYYSGCVFKDPRGKYSPDFYPCIIRHGQFQPETLMMIGDEPDRDAVPAVAAGFGYGVTINRKQNLPIIEVGNTIFVNSLEVLTPLVEASRGKRWKTS